MNCGNIHKYTRNCLREEGRHTSCCVCDAGVERVAGAAQLILASHSSTFCLARRRVHASYVIYCHANSCFSVAHVFITFHIEVLFRCLSIRNLVSYLLCLLSTSVNFNPFKSINELVRLQ